MIRIHQLKLDYRGQRADLFQAAAKKLRLSPENIKDLIVVRKSIDARKGLITAVFTVDVEVPGEKALLKKFTKDKNITLAVQEDYVFPKPCLHGSPVRPVIAGSGPAGLFCGLMLARNGYRPIIFERGSDVHTRLEKVKRFWEEGVLDPKCNVQFGEGGAGTFSDGKLNTLVKDKTGRNRKVLELFCEAGAPEEILYVSKPHIGTDILVHVVEHMRNEIITLGGEVHFDSEITDLKIEDGRLVAVEVDHNNLMETQVLVLAIGHSARNTFEMLLDNKLDMSAKAFAVGVRIEHPQEMIDQAQYSRSRDEWLNAADYKLTHQCTNGRGVYTFCMCPGGYVVNASSEPEATAVNGMSYSTRDSANANSAVIVTVTPEDFDGSGPLSGVEFQRRLERDCFMEAQRSGGTYKIPVQQFGDFCGNRQSSGYGSVLPVHCGGSVPANLRHCLPEPVCESLIEGITAFGRKIQGFDRPDALLSGVESRTSSPVRIHRDEHMETNISGIFPCGEGAGYAGGITSAAMDGLRVAEEIARRFSPPAKRPDPEHT